VPQGTPRARGAALASSAVVSAVPNAAITQPAAAQAQLEWGGPQNVKLGTRFDVTLRVKSNETLHAWPMQFKFDPNVFEVVTVKPGRAAGGAVPSFDYRVNQNGSIEIGATAQSGTSGSNAELVVLTLIPMRAASAAELNLTSLLLQGPAGRAIAYERIASFKTSITP
jgi:hypothetical protein